MRVWLKSNKIEICILTLLSLFVSGVSYLQLKGFGISFFDTDDYMYLVHEFEWLSGENFYNNVIERANSPFGGSMHWTRFYDLLWLIPVRFVSLFTNSLKNAIEIVGFVISPIIQIFSILLLLRIVQFVLSKRDAFIAVALFLSHPFVVSQTIFGRPDHHAFIIFMIIAYVYFIIRLVEENFEKQDTGIIVAILSALCIWASPETLIPLLISDIVLFCISFGNANTLKILYLKSIITACIIGMLTYVSGDTTNYALMLSMILLMLPYATFNVNQPKSTILKNWHIAVLALITIITPMLQPITYDALSCVHMSLYVYEAIFFCISILYANNTTKNRLFYTLTWGTIIAIAYLLNYPKFLFGMSADISPYVKEIWLKHVGEMKSPFADTSYFGHLLGVSIIFMSIIYRTYLLFKQKSLSAKNIIWLFFVTIGFLYTVLGCISYRMTAYAILFACPIVTDFIMESRFLSRLPRYVKLLFAVTLILLPRLSFGGEKETNAREHKGYTEYEFFNLLDTLPHSPATILTYIDLGPEILWRTNQKIVAAPYHRHEHGIIAHHKILQKAFNAQDVKKYLNDTDYIVIVKDKKYSKQSLCYYLTQYADCNGWLKKGGELRKVVPNEIIEWLSIVPIDKKFHDVVIAKVNHEN